MSMSRKHVTNSKSNRNSRLRALVAVELKSYVAILAPPKQKNNHAAVELNLFFFNFIATVHIYI